ncbi:hypothetical protein [Nocardia nepalensis]|uniref:WXG100 family type VII secretion target n=1 Tax=Nocardia nepalensis TaxID=3375448 RepID=UPI003B67DA6C
MAQSLRVDTDTLRALIPELDAITDTAQTELTSLKAAIDRQGECWGDDEPGKVFGESYAPAAKKGVAGFQNLVDNLRAMSRGIADTANTFHNNDHEIGSHIRDLAPSPALGSSPDRPISSPPTTPRYPQSPIGAQPNPNPTTAADPSAAHTTASPVPGTSSPDAAGTGPISPDAAGTGPISPTRPDYQPNGNPAVSGRPESVDGSPSPSAATPEAQSTPDSPAQPPVVAPTMPSATATPAATEPTSAAPKSTDTPWSKPTGDAAAPRNMSGTPWSRGLGTPPPGQVFRPRRTSPQPGVAKPAAPSREAKSRKPKREPAKAGRISARTDPGALTAAQALAARHGLQIAGFDAPGIAAHQVHEMAAAVDDILGKYPFLEVGGIEITELGDGEVSRSAWDRSDSAADDAPWILFDRTVMANPVLLDEKFRAATRSGEAIPESGKRPMYSTVVTELGRIMAAAAGPLPRRQAQRALITEYRRISGPWDRTNTLAGVVDGYRGWRGELSGRCFSHGRFDPGAAVVEAFTEVELRGPDACGAAKVLHRLVVENARGQSSA